MVKVPICDFYPRKSMFNERRTGKTDRKGGKICNLICLGLDIPIGVVLCYYRLTI